MDKQEFTRLAELYMDTVYRVARIGTRNDADAEDIAQTTFLKLISHRGSFNDDDHARRWLIRVAVNESNLLWRRRRREDCLETDEELTVQDDFTEKGSELFSALSQLSLEYRQITSIN